MTRFELRWHDRGPLRPLPVAWDTQRSQGEIFADVPTALEEVEERNREEVERQARWAGGGKPVGWLPEVMPARCVADDLVAFLGACLDEDERWAMEASRDRDKGQTETGEHWRWEDCDTDSVLVPDPMVHEFVGGDVRVSLRSVEEYPSSVGTLPHFVVRSAEEVSATVAGHIARWDPARVLAEVRSKREILREHHRLNPGACVRCRDWDGGHSTQPYPCRTVLALAAPFAGRPGWRPEWVEA